MDHSNRIVKLMQVANDKAWTASEALKLAKIYASLGLYHAAAVELRRGRRARRAADRIVNDLIPLVA